MNVLHSKHWRLAVCAAGLGRRDATLSGFFKWSRDRAIPGCIFRSLSSDSPSGWLGSAFPRQSRCHFLSLIPSCYPSRLLTGCCYKWLHVDMQGRKWGKVLCLVHRCCGKAGSRWPCSEASSEPPHFQLWILSGILRGVGRGVDSFHNL